MDERGLRADLPRQPCSLIVMLLLSVMPMESQIVNTFHSSSSFNGDSSKLVDNEGLGGDFRQG